MDAAVAAWTALRRNRGEAEFVYSPERYDKGIETTIYF